MTGIRTFDVTSKNLSMVTWWNNKYPREPYDNLDSDALFAVARKYEKGVLKDARRMLQNTVGTLPPAEPILVTDVKIKGYDKSQIVFTVTVMGSLEDINNIDPSKIK
jgi:hypothetical protein